MLSSHWKRFGTGEDSTFQRWFIKKMSRCVKLQERKRPKILNSCAAESDRWL